MPRKREAAACTMRCPPPTEPVKATKETRGSAMAASVRGWSRWIAWKTPSGSPAASKASAKRSATRSVDVECFSTTAFPATMAGTTLFTAMR